MSLGVAFRAFFSALSNSKRSEAIRKVLDADVAVLDNLGRLEQNPPAAAVKAAANDGGEKAQHGEIKPHKKEGRSEALTLLSVLQREARLIDLIQEPLDQYADAQVGAAARPCLKQCRQAIQRIFDLQAILNEPENAVIEVPENASAVRYQWVGEPGKGGGSGKIIHPGWIAKKLELPHWTGSEDDSSVIAAAEVERVG